MLEEILRVSKSVKDYLNEEGRTLPLSKGKLYDGAIDLTIADQSQTA